MLTPIYPIVGTTWLLINACESKECLIIWPMCAGTKTDRWQSTILKTNCVRWEERGMSAFGWAKLTLCHM